MKAHSLKRRQFLGVISFLFLPLSPCKAAPMTVTLDVVTFNYWNQPIFDVYIDGKGGG